MHKFLRLLFGKILANIKYNYHLYKSALQNSPSMYLGL